MGKARYTEEFKQIAVGQILEQGYSVLEVSQNLGVSTHSLYKWIKQDPRNSETSILQQKGSFIRSIDFSIGGFAEGHKRIKIIKSTDEVCLKYTPHGYFSDNELSKIIDNMSWNKFVEQLRKCRIHKWKKHYNNRYILDGTQWELIFEYDDGSLVNKDGSNEYPANWKEFMQALTDLPINEIDLAEFDEPNEQDQ